MRARSRVSALVLASALVATGCGRGGADDEVATVRELDLLGGAEQAGSARVSLHYDVELSAEEGFGVAVHTAADLEGESHPR